MDDRVYEKNQRVFQTARTAAVLTGAITAFITFAAFMIAGFGIQETAAWMFALSLMSASALFIVMHIVTTNELKKTQQT
ncbi:hypothetical protein [Brevibacterium aurantiacum]|uniref:Uncharacterized protein n=1 Tax=Brevibacterium aurantiacum TaxID=273384 RepID=A0A556CGV8_BREAU|nr:hypothetical protein [Brevibacterium aurantiacum]TSI16674.1 hypothetical protein FO013_07435 [Brevibacterium aurantiacum]